MADDRSYQEVVWTDIFTLSLRCREWGNHATIAVRAYERDMVRSTVRCPMTVRLLAAMISPLLYGGLRRGASRLQRQQRLTFGASNPLEDAGVDRPFGLFRVLPARCCATPGDLVISHSVPLLYFPLPRETGSQPSCVT
jgi:hypothetical protein